jgi:hypothetical protein
MGVLVLTWESNVLLLLRLAVTTAAAAAVDEDPPCRLLTIDRQPRGLIFILPYFAPGHYCRCCYKKATFAKIVSQARIHNLDQNFPSGYGKLGLS